MLGVKGVDVWAIILNYLRPCAVLRGCFPPPYFFFLKSIWRCLLKLSMIYFYYMVKQKLWGILDIITFINQFLLIQKLQANQCENMVAKSKSKVIGVKSAQPAFNVSEAHCPAADNGTLLPLFLFSLTIACSLLLLLYSILMSIGEEKGSSYSTYCCKTNR